MEALIMLDQMPGKPNRKVEQIDSFDFAWALRLD